MTTTNTEGPSTVELTDVPAPKAGEGEIEIAVEYSSLNYKDALALAGRPGIVRGDVVTAGIDAVGIVRDSRDPRWEPGDSVIVTGHGLGETQDGGLAETVVVSGDGAVRVPDCFNARQAAAIGTAGVTAALCVDELAGAGALGSVAVTGAGGGVGGLAIRLLDAAGATVTAITGRIELADALVELGANAVAARTEWEGEGRALESARWDGVVDTVGGPILARLIAQTRPGGTITACGNAATMDLPASVAPFILRGVRLIGINSGFPPSAARAAAWARLESDIDPVSLDSTTDIVGLADAIATAERVLAGRVHGRIVVDVRD